MYSYFPASTRFPRKEVSKKAAFREFPRPFISSRPYAFQHEQSSLLFPLVSPWHLSRFAFSLGSRSPSPAGRETALVSSSTYFFQFIPARTGSRSIEFTRNTYTYDCFPDPTSFRVLRFFAAVRLSSHSFILPHRLHLSFLLPLHFLGYPAKRMHTYAGRAGAGAAQTWTIIPF